jgi:hypothetical protein
MKAIRMMSGRLARAGGGTRPFDWMALITHRQASPSETREACAGRTGLVEHRESAHLREHACTRPSRLNRQDAGQRRKDDQNLKPTKPARHGIHTSLS